MQEEFILQQATCISSGLFRLTGVSDFWLRELSLLRSVKGRKRNYDIE